MQITSILCCLLFFKLPRDNEIISKEKRFQKSPTEVVNSARIIDPSLRDLIKFHPVNGICSGWQVRKAG